MKKYLSKIIPSKGDLCVIAGTAVLFYGTYLLNHAAAFILLGCELTAIGVLFVRSESTSGFEVEL